PINHLLPWLLRFLQPHLAKQIQLLSIKSYNTFMARSDGEPSPSTCLTHYSRAWHRPMHFPLSTAPTLRQETTRYHKYYVKSGRKSLPCSYSSSVSNGGSLAAATATETLQ